MKTTEKDNTQDLETKALKHITNSPSIAVDYDAYAHLLEHSQMDEKQKLAFIQSLWSIIYSFASLGFCKHPVQQVSSGRCGQVTERSQKSASASQIRLHFNSINHQKGSAKRNAVDQSGVEHAAK